MKIALPAALCTLLAFPLTALAQCDTCATYRTEYRTAYYPQEVTTYKVEFETVYKPQTVTRYRPVWETSEQVREYVVRRPVMETQYRDENYVAYEPHTTYRVAHEDRGCWQMQQTYKPGPVTHCLRWQQGGCQVDPATGHSTYYRGGLAWVPVQHPGTVETQQVWKPNVVEVRIPQTQYVQKVCTRKVPVQVCNYHDEVVVEKTPIRVCKMQAYEETIQVAECRRNVIPVTTTYMAPRVECYRVPIDPCSGQPIGAAMPVVEGPVVEGPGVEGPPPQPEPTPAEEGAGGMAKPELGSDENPN